MPEQIPTNLRMLLILEELAKAGVPVTPTEVNHSVGLPKPTIHRLFATLEAQGFVQRELDGRSYTAGRRLRHLSSNVLSSLRIRTARVSVLKKLTDEIGETCNIVAPDRDAMIYLDRVETKWPLRIQLPIGSEVPFHCTASGKLYLSTLDERHLERYLHSAKLEPHTQRTLTTAGKLRCEIEKIRKLGHSWDNEEFLENMVAVAVPIINDQQRFVSALAVHGPTIRLSLNKAFGLLPLIHHAASELASLLIE